MSNKHLTTVYSLEDLLNSCVHYGGHKGYQEDRNLILTCEVLSSVSWSLCENWAVRTSEIQCC